MKKYLISFACLVCAIAVYVTANSKNEGQDLTLFNQVEVLALPESGSRVECRCSRNVLWLGNNDCMASNRGALCAQSAPGGNINCREYDSQC